MFVVLADFDSSRAGEHMVASLGRTFRHTARSGKVAAFVIARNRDGSFTLVQSRVLTAGLVVRAAIKFTAGVHWPAAPVPRRLVARGMLDWGAADFLRACVRARLSIVFAGPPGSGKTTLLSCCAAELAPGIERGDRRGGLRHRHRLTQRRLR